MGRGNTSSGSGTSRGGLVLVGRGSTSRGG